MKQPKLLECKNLTKKFKDQVALDHVSLTLEPGHIYGLLGPNGAGKSTLIKIINTLLTPTSGSVKFNGQPLGLESKSAISYLPEHTYLDRTAKISDALQLFRDFYPDFDDTKAENLLATFELDRAKRISNLSKGMQEKLQLALVMSRHAKLYILDEPLGGVDPATRDDVLDAILDNFDASSSLLISTHLIADVERILDYVYFIDHGKIVLEDATDALRQKHQSSIDKIFRQTFNHHKANH